MKDWSVRRLDINRKVRKVLVRYGIDLGLIMVRVYPRRIILRGNMNRLAGSGDPLDAITVEAIIRDLERIEEVNLVHYDLGNWAFCSSSRTWQKTQTPTDALCGDTACLPAAKGPGSVDLRPIRA